MSGGMSHSEIDLSALDDTYENLAELERSNESITYLGRHRELGRDVLITVVHVAEGGENNTLTHFASDARLLSSMRHPHVAAVVDSRWLGDDTLAVVRARVRGSTLDQAVTAVGAFPPARVASVLSDVSSAIEWARGNGVIHRRVTPDSVWFQQGNGKVLVTLEPVSIAADALPDACDDARALGEIAWTMLAG